MPVCLSLVTHGYEAFVHYMSADILIVANVDPAVVYFDIVEWSGCTDWAIVECYGVTWAGMVCESVCAV